MTCGSLTAAALVHIVVICASLSDLAAAEESVRVPTLQDRGIWQNQLPGVITVGENTQAVSLQLFLKGICHDDEISLRGQMFALSNSQLRWSLSHAHLLQPKELLHWRPQIFFKHGRRHFWAKVQNVSSHFLEPPWQGGHGDGITIPVSFNATLPANLSDEALTMGIKGWDYVHWIHPASDLQLQCITAHKGEERVEVLHVMPPIIGKPSPAQMVLLAQQLSWDQSIGIKQTVIFVTKESVREHWEDARIQHHLKLDHITMILWDGLPSCKGKPYCVKVLNWSLSLLLFWGTEEKWLLMSDLDEFIALPQPTTVPAMLVDCLQSASYAILPRYDAHCPTCTDEQVRPWESDVPLSFYTQRATMRLNGKSIVSTHKTHAFAIHSGQADEEYVEAPESCAFIVHLVNFHHSRVTYSQELAHKLINDSGWMWPLRKSVESIATSL